MSDFFRCFDVFISVALVCVLPNIYVFTILVLVSLVCTKIDKSIPDTVSSIDIIQSKKVPSPILSTYVHLLVT